MDAIKRTLEQIAERFRLLETSQKLAILLCAVVIAGSLVSLVGWSTAPDLVPIMSKDFSLDQLDAAEDALQAAGIKYERAGGRLMVREQDKYNAIRELNRADALPQDFAFGFAELFGKDSTFKPASVLEHERQVALGYELAKVIASSPAVENAFVVIQQQSKRTLGQPSVRPSASVKLTMKSNQTVTPTVVEGCAKLVATAVAGLSPHDVTVFDTRTLKAYTVPNPEDVLAQGLLDERKRNEQYLQSNVLAQLAYIPGVLVSVSVELDGSKSRTESIAYGDAEVKTEESKTSRSGTAASGGESGVNPNTGVALSSGTGGGSSETEESRTDNFEPKVTERRVEDKAPFSLKRATAAINVPRSYVLGVFKARNPDKEAPRDTDTEFVAVRDAVFTTVRDSVRNIIQSKSDTDVQVDMFYDMEPVSGVLASAAGGGPAETTTASTASLVKTYAPQLGLGGLALLSLGMMMMMVRKTAGTVRKTVPVSEEDSSPFAVASDGVLAVAGGPVGRAEASEGFLVGREVDQETLQNKQLDEQVARLVDDDPAGVADLLRRWVEQDD